MPTLGLGEPNMVTATKVPIINSATSGEMKTQSLSSIRGSSPAGDDATIPNFKNSNSASTVKHASIAGLQNVLALVPDEPIGEGSPDSAFNLDKVLQKPDASTTLNKKSTRASNRKKANPKKQSGGVKGNITGFNLFQTSVTNETKLKRGDPLTSKERSMLWQKEDQAVWNNKAKQQNKQRNDRAKQFGGAAAASTKKTVGSSQRPRHPRKSKPASTSDRKGVGQSLSASANTRAQPPIIFAPHENQDGVGGASNKGGAEATQGSKSPSVSTRNILADEQLMIDMQMIGLRKTSMTSNNKKTRGPETVDRDQAGASVNEKSLSMKRGGNTKKSDSIAGKSRHYQDARPKNNTATSSSTNRRGIDAPAGRGASNKGGAGQADNATRRQHLKSAARTQLVKEKQTLGTASKNMPAQVSTAAQAPPQVQYPKKPPSVSATKQSIGLPRNSNGAQAVPTIQRNRDTELNSLRSDVTSLQLTSSQNDITVEQLKEKVDKDQANMATTLRKNQDALEQLQGQVASAEVARKNDFDSCMSQVQELFDLSSKTAADSKQAQEEREKALKQAQEEREKAQEEERKAIKLAISVLREKSETDSGRITDNRLAIEALQADFLLRYSEQEKRHSEQEKRYAEQFLRYAEQEKLIESLDKACQQGAKELKKFKRQLKKQLESEFGAPPKKFLNAYIVFVISTRPKLQIPRGTPFAEVSKRMGNLWRNMADDEKEEYKQEAERNKEDYERKMDEWKRNKATIQQKKLASPQPSTPEGSVPEESLAAQSTAGHAASPTAPTASSNRKRKKHNNRRSVLEAGSLQDLESPTKKGRTSSRATLATRRTSTRAPVGTTFHKFIPQNSRRNGEWREVEVIEVMDSNRRKCRYAGSAREYEFTVDKIEAFERAWLDEQS